MPIGAIRFQPIAPVVGSTSHIHIIFWIGVRTSCFVRFIIITISALCALEWRMLEPQSFELLFCTFHPLLIRGVGGADLPKTCFKKHKLTIHTHTKY